MGSMQLPCHHMPMYHHPARILERQKRQNTRECVYKDLRDPLVCSITRSRPGKVLRIEHIPLTTRALDLMVIESYSKPFPQRVLQYCMHVTRTELMNMDEKRIGIEISLDLASLPLISRVNESAKKLLSKVQAKCTGLHEGSAATSHSDDSAAAGSQTFRVFTKD